MSGPRDKWEMEAQRCEVATPAQGPGVGLGMALSPFDSKALSRTLLSQAAFLCQWEPPLLTWQGGELHGRPAGDLAGVQLHAVVFKDGPPPGF